MLKVVFLLVLGFSSVFAGWFSSNLIDEKFELEGTIVRVVTNTETNEISFEDRYLSDRSKDSYYSELRQRGNIVFNFIKKHGKEKGFKSFSIQNKFLSQESGFILDNTEDIVKYCTLGKEYTTFCSAGNNGILLLNATKYSIKVIFYSDNSGAISL